MDSNSEKIVQDALNQLSKGLTTVTIAHRIKTISDSDKIFVIGNRKVQEQGKYDELMKLEGEFYKINKGM